MPYDGKYGHVTIERGNIPDDEPVIVFRGKDALVPEMLDYYRDQCVRNGTVAAHIHAVDFARARVSRFQSEQPEKVKLPDTEPGSVYL